MDCKGCEFFTTDDEFKLAKRVKIEYYKQNPTQKIDSLVAMLKNLKYDVIVYKHTPSDTTPLTVYGNIFGILQGN